MPEHFPLFYPADARRAFGSEDYARRIARVAHLGGGSRVLELCAGTTGIFLAREFGCSVVAADTDERVVEALRERVKAHVLSDRVEVKPVSPHGTEVYVEKTLQFLDRSAALDAAAVERAAGSAARGAEYARRDAGSPPLRAGNRMRA